MSETSTSGRSSAGWRSLAASLVFRQSPFIDGGFVAAESQDRFETINPATGQPLCGLPVGSAGDVDRAVQAARRAFEDGRWSALGPGQRRIVLLRLADLVEENADELALLDCLEMGKAISSALAEIAMGTGLIRYFAETIDKLYGSLAPSDSNVIAFSQFEPRGVVGAIVPWNFPLINAIVKAAPALAVGNSVILKPSEIASLSALRLAEIALEAGLPPGVLNVLPGLGSTIGEAIGRHQGIDFVSFTGSTATGRKLLCYSGESNGKPLMLELGGKSAQIVCADMADDLEGLAAQIVQDAFWNQGQWCAARTRLIVERGLYAPLMDAVIAAAAKLVPGDPLDPATNFGTIASKVQFDRVRSYIDRGRAEGALILLAGGSGKPCALSMAPAIFGNVDPAMAIAQDEIFGPVLAAMPFEGFEQAVALSNSSGYGLGATVWTSDSRRARIAARALRVGKVLVKTSVSAKGSSGFALGGEPFGASGFGIERGIEGLKSYCRTKAVELIS